MDFNDMWNICCLSCKINFHQLILIANLIWSYCRWLPSLYYMHFLKYTVEGKSCIFIVMWVSHKRQWMIEQGHDIQLWMLHLYYILHDIYIAHCDFHIVKARSSKMQEPYSNHFVRPSVCLVILSTCNAITQKLPTQRLHIWYIDGRQRKKTPIGFWGQRSLLRRHW